MIVVVSAFGAMFAAYVLMVMPRILDRYPDDPADHGDRFLENEVGHACRRDAIVDGICIDCEHPPSRIDVCRSRKPTRVLAQPVFSASTSRGLGH